VRIRSIALAGLAAVAVAYFFRPTTGRARRSRLRERFAAIARRRMIPTRPPLPDNMIPAPANERADTPEERTSEAAADTPEERTSEAAADTPEERPSKAAADTPRGRAVDDIVYMPQERLRGYLADTRENRTMDDGAIVGRIRMKVLERADLETGSLLIDVVQGVAFLRGELKDRKAIEEIVDLTRSVPGVREVQNLLVIRLPESPAISRSAAESLGDAWNG
jgi:hypothetical protein